MKKYFSIILLSILLLLISGCSKDETALEPIQEVEETISLANKTFYNTTDRFVEYDSPEISFYEDSSFELRDSDENGYIVYNGTYKLGDGVVICDVLMSSSQNIREIIFNVEGEDLVFDSELSGCRVGDYFIIRPVDDDNDKLFTGTFINATQKARGGFGASSLELREDGTFSLTEIVGMGATLVNGKFSRENEILMFYDFDCEFMNMDGEELFNFEFFIVDDNTLESMRNLEGSEMGDCFSKDGLVPDNFVSRFKKEISYVTYVHEPIEGVDDSYLPLLELFDDGTFIFVENCYEWIGEISGTYSETENGYWLIVTDNSNIQGFVGEDVTSIVFDFYEGKLMLCNDLCMSRCGDAFILRK